MSSLYEFNQNRDIDGNVIDWKAKVGGKVVLITNVASNCGKTPNHYKQMAELQSAFAADGFQIVCFPCNQFKGQEPKGNAEIKKFVQESKKVGLGNDCGGLLMMAKIDVNGDNVDPVYKWLKQAGTDNEDIGWNFKKYFLLNRSGKFVQALDGTPKTMHSAVQEALGGSASAEEAAGSLGGAAGALKKTSTASTTNIKAPTKKKVSSSMKKQTAPAEKKNTVQKSTSKKTETNGRGGAVGVKKTGKKKSDIK